MESRGDQTSIRLNVAPDQVRRAIARRRSRWRQRLARDFRPLVAATGQRVAPLAWQTQDLNPTGGMRRSDPGDAAIGAAWLEQAAQAGPRHAGVDVSRSKYCASGI